MIRYEDQCVGCPHGMGCLGAGCPNRNVPVACCDRCESDDEVFFLLEDECLCEDCYVKALLASAKMKTNAKCDCCEKDSETLYELDGEWFCRECFTEVAIDAADSITSESIVMHACW